MDLRGIEPGLEGHGQLAAGCDVDRETLLAKKTVRGQTRKRLACEQDLCVATVPLERRQVLPSALAHVLLGIDVRRGADLICQLDQIAASDLEMPIWVDPRIGRPGR